ncbi:MAG: hypothetical protein CMP95_09410 [Gammaproteobacteria bacterium]|uniref:LysM domain-containing protein n=1 Tax=OM182 bacterium TaxID=2510334 RepID=A0A520S0Z6_9GAMM|nr:hypothetical protein [Gammaproteobacteria bacterium]OUV67436.1 MAG: hypothetical protein CBC93_05280 [Gammaproteobacteria bacterium TMED133]RZO76142.1 MAG: hypothetical protein EVA68_05185 [OM182 bacterium]
MSPVPEGEHEESAKDLEQKPNAALAKVIGDSKYVAVEGELQSIAESSELEIALENMLSRLVKSVDVVNAEEKGWVKGIYQVKKGDTLSKIVQESVKGTQIRPEFMLDAIVRLNPSAFVRGNPNWMYAGSKLRFPGAEDFSQLIFMNSSEKNEGKEAEDPYSGWIKYP